MKPPKEAIDKPQDPGNVLPKDRTRDEHLIYLNLMKNPTVDEMNPILLEELQKLEKIYSGQENTQMLERVQNILNNYEPWMELIGEVFKQHNKKLTQYVQAVVDKNVKPENHIGFIKTGLILNAVKKVLEDQKLAI